MKQQSYMQLQGRAAAPPAAEGTWRVASQLTRGGQRSRDLPKKQNLVAHESCESGRRMAWPFAATTSVFLLVVCVYPAGVSTTLASAPAPAWQHPQILRIRNRGARIRRFPQAAASRPNFWGKKQSAGWERELETTLAKTDPSGKILCHPVAHLSWYQIPST
jgi:hypothetical protein